MICGSHTANQSLTYVYDIRAYFEFQAPDMFRNDILPW